MTSSKHPKTRNPTDADLRADPGIGRSKGRFAETDAPALEGEATTEGDVMNDATAAGGVDPAQTGRTNK